MRRVQLVSGLLEQTSITAATQRLRISLGVELVDALSNYSNVLDVFDEVVSWREMALSSTRSPLAFGSIDRTTLSIKGDSIFAMLFQDGSEVEETPPIMSSTLEARSTDVVVVTLTWFTIFTLKIVTIYYSVCPPCRTLPCRQL